MTGLLRPEDEQKLAEIVRLLDEAYDHYFIYSDGYCKSSEGHIGLSLTNYFDRQEGRSGIQSVSIDSYVLGPHRTHYFASLDEALETVKRWHKAEMEHDYAADWAAEEATWD